MPAGLRLMRGRPGAVCLLAVLVLAACQPQSRRDGSAPPEPVAVEFDRYLGRWYEIARFPNRFERGCAGVTLRYERVSRRRLSLRGSCRAGGPQGEIRHMEARARIAGPGLLRVSYLPEGLSFLDGLAAGDYRVLWLDPDYRAAVVGEASGRYGWILTRDPQPEAALTGAALAALGRAGYRTAGLEWVVHGDAAEGIEGGGEG